MATTPITRRMPIGMLDHLQTICARQDQQFISDVARILDIPTSDMRRKILGVLGTPTTVFTESNPWWMDTQCPIMSQSPCGMWKRCGNMSESHGTCWKHRTTKGPVYSDPIFTKMEDRIPFRYNNEVYWAAKDGSVLDSTGSIVMDFKFSLKSRTVIAINTENDKKCSDV